MARGRSNRERRYDLRSRRAAIGITICVVTVILIRLQTPLTEAVGCEISSLWIEAIHSVWENRGGRSPEILPASIADSRLIFDGQTVLHFSDTRRGPCGPFGEISLV